MKKCNNCNIGFDGDRKNCPLCQNKLTGDASPYNWPPIKPKTKKNAFLYKLQLTIVLAVVAISLILDYRMDIDFGTGKHLSIIIAGWGISGELLARSFIIKRPFAAKIISISVVMVSVLACLTAYYLNFFRPVFYIAVPALISATIIANFVLCFIDKKGNTLVYLLSTIVIGVIPYIALAIGHEDFLLPWTICLLISIVAFLGIIVFSGRKVLTELQKRFNF